MSMFLLGFESAGAQAKEEQRPKLQKRIDEEKKTQKKLKETVRQKEVEAQHLNSKQDSAIKTKKLFDDLQIEGADAQMSAGAALLIELQELMEEANTAMVQAQFDVAQAEALVASSQEVLQHAAALLVEATQDKALAQTALDAAQAGGDPAAIAAAQAALDESIQYELYANAQVDAFTPLLAQAKDQLEDEQEDFHEAWAVLEQAVGAYNGARDVLAAYAGLDPLRLQNTFSDAAAALLNLDTQLDVANQSLANAQDWRAIKQDHRESAVSDHASALAAYEAAVAADEGVAEALAALNAAADEMSSAVAAEDAAVEAVTAAAAFVQEVQEARAAAAVAFARAQAALTVYELHRSAATTGRPGLVLASIAEAVNSQAGALLRSRLADAAQALLISQLQRLLDF